MFKPAHHILILAPLVLMAACGKKDMATLPPAPGQDNGYDSAQYGPQKGSQEDFVASITADRIFFDTDKSNVDIEDQRVLQSQAAWLIANPSAKIRLEGHCDERGTREYNLALGERRANAAKNYLSSLGIESSRITVVSFGKEHPDSIGSSEIDWSRNRRAVTVVIG